MTAAATVRDIIAEHLGRPAAEISDALQLGDDLNFDSLDRIEVVMEIERTLGVAIDDDTIERLQTVGELVRCAEPAEGGG